MGKKKHKVWVWTTVDKRFPGILAFVVGDRSQETFKPLWKIIGGWGCFFYVTDGYAVYPQLIDELDHIVSKPSMTRVEGENTRLRHDLARLKRKTLCYSTSVEMLTISLRLLLYYLKHRTIPLPN